MNAQQRYTGIGCAVIAIAVGLVSIGALVLEGHAVHVGGNSTISELIWGVWAEQPWVVLLVSHVIAAPVWFLSGHFFAQSREVYARLRREHEEGK